MNYTNKFNNVFNSLQVIIKPCLPAIYINKTLSLAIGQRRIKELLKINSSSSESESHSLSEDEELPHEAREVLKPNSQQRSDINKEKKAKRKINKKKTLGHYQKPQQKVEKKSQNFNFK